MVALIYQRQFTACMLPFKTPILFLVFNRVDTTQRVFNRIKEIKPETLYVAADGPRKSKENESELCNKVRSIIDDGIDWDCQVHKLYRKENLGCGKAVSNSITWFFENVEDGIILEDDTLPDISFFHYCKELLVKYRTDSKVMMISGNNFRLNGKQVSDSYNFTRYCHVWGWATWKRAWDLYDFQMADWPKLNKKGLLQKIFSDSIEIEYWEKIFDRMHSGLEDTWDYQWYYTCWKYNGVSIEPAENLVANIGFGNNATHTTASAEYFIFGNLLVKNLIIQQHPKEIKIDMAGDRITFINRYLNGGILQEPLNSTVGKIKHNILKVKRYLLPNTYFGIKEKFADIKYAFLYSKKKLLRQRLPINNDNKVYIHLGCGEINCPKFINVDARAYEHVHYIHKVDKLPFFKDEIADIVYVSHCLEHIPFRDAITTLKEWFRILKPGGILRISVPDFELLLKIYFDNNKDMNSILQPLVGGQDYKYNFHYNSFNYESLKALLLQAGFGRVQRWEFGKDEFSSLPDWSGRDIVVNDKAYKVSLNIEGIK